MRWVDVLATQPHLAADAQASFDAGRHKTLATIRPDGSPRISGVEAAFLDGDLWFGSSLGSPKSRDLLRDPRFALHSPSAEPEVWRGDAKITGRAIPVTDRDAKERLTAAAGSAPPGDGDFDLFRVEVDEVVVIRLDDPPDQLLIGSWRPGGELRVTSSR